MVQRNSGQGRYLDAQAPIATGETTLGGVTEHRLRGDRIRNAREAAGLSQTKLGEAVGVNQSVISDAETGSGTVSRETLRRIAVRLKHSVDFFLGLDGMPNELRDWEERQMAALGRSGKRDLQELMESGSRSIDDILERLRDDLRREASKARKAKKGPKR